MKYLRITTTFIVLICLASISDMIYEEKLKSIMLKETGIWYWIVYVFLSASRLIIGWMMGTNTVRISNWIWDKEDFLKFKCSHD